MAQVTWRASEDLVDRVRTAAREAGSSMNDYVSGVLDAATDPDLAGDEVERLRTRLRRAGLLAEPGRPRVRPASERLVEASQAAGDGTSLAELVSQGR